MPRPDEKKVDRVVIVHEQPSHPHQTSCPVGDFLKRMKAQR